MKQTIELKKSEKFEQFEQLPEDIQKVIMNEHINGKNEIQNKVVRINQQCYRLFQPDLVTKKFLFFVAIGNQDDAEQMLKSDLTLLLKRGNVTDYSRRTFTNITAFEYVLWALDTRYMANMMLDCLPCTIEGEKIKQDLQKQYDSFTDKDKGIHYTLDGKDYQESHFDFSPLLKALRDLLENVRKRGLWEMEKYWCKKVGLAQCGLPAHV